MATWNDFPQEIGLHILKIFSIDLVDDYRSPAQWEPVRPEEKNHVFTWPKSPPSLKSLSSAVLTCRAFHDALTRVIRIEDLPPYELLRSLQAQIIDIVTRDYGEPDILYVRDLYHRAGMFWKNSIVCEDRDYIVGLLQSLSAKSLLALLPHLEPWILNQATSTGWSMPLVMARNLPIDDGWPKYVMVCTVKEPNKGESSAFFADSPGLLEMGPSVEDTWWFFKVWRHLHEPWVLVNYREKKIFGGSVKPVFFEWEDIWEPESWRVVGEQITLGEYWRRDRVVHDNSDSESENSDTGC